jgi:hypothetical protein
MSEPLDPDDIPPSNWKHLGELTWFVPRVLRRFGSLGPHGPEDGPPAIVIPGFVASDRTTMTLRKTLAEAGWRVHGWGLGFNRGAHPDILQDLKRQLERIWDGRPILVVGWSLGGVFARELAREAPDMIRAVVTLGSPFSGHPRQNNVWRMYELVAGHKVDQPPIPHFPDKPPVPTLALWSRKDGIVAPRAAYGLEGERDVAVEVDCSHMAFGISRRAGARIVSEIDKFLAEVEEQPTVPKRRSAVR